MISTDGSMATLVAAVEDSGGTVTDEYHNLDTVVVEMSDDSLDLLEGDLGGEIRIIADSLLAAPSSVYPFTDRGKVTPSAPPGSLADISHLGKTSIVNIPAFALAHPGAYALNHFADNVSDLHAQGIAGDGVVVAVLDSGFRPGFGVLDNSQVSHLGKTSIVNIPAFALAHPGAYALNHFADNVSDLHAQGIAGDGVVVAVLDSGFRPGFGVLDNSQVIGCESFVPGDNSGCVNPSNDGHGTMVAGLIAGRSTVEFSSSSVFLNSVNVYAPGATLDLDGDQFDESVALIGSAPDAEIYMIKVFASSMTPTPTSP